LADETDIDQTPGGPTPTTGGAPRSVVVIAAWIVTRILALVVVIWAIAFGVSKLPSDTVWSDVFVRALIGIAIGFVLTFYVRRMLRTFGEAPPPPPEKVDALPAEIVYECPTCGTRVRLEVAATAKAPRHCGEEMEARIG
jgi:hypothetical protein